MTPIVIPSDTHPQVLYFPNWLDNLTKDDDSKYLTTQYPEPQYQIVRVRKNKAIYMKSVLLYKAGTFFCVPSSQSINEVAFPFGMCTLSAFMQDMVQRVNAANKHRLKM